MWPRIALSGFVLAELDGKPTMTYLETAAEGQVTDSPAVAGHVTPPVLS
jgi:hypothetical protein